MARPRGVRQVDLGLIGGMSKAEYYWQYRLKKALKVVKEKYGIEFATKYKVACSKERKIVKLNQFIVSSQIKQY